MNKLLNIYHIFCIKTESKVYPVEKCTCLKDKRKLRFHFFAFILLSCNVKEHFQDFWPPLSFWTMGLIGKKQYKVKKCSKLMFCLQHVVYAGMNTHQREYIKREAKNKSKYIIFFRQLMSFVSYITYNH